MCSNVGIYFISLVSSFIVLILNTLLFPIWPTWFIFHCLIPYIFQMWILLFHFTLSTCQFFIVFITLLGVTPNTIASFFELVQDSLNITFIHFPVMPELSNTLISFIPHDFHVIFAHILILSVFLIPKTFRYSFLQTILLIYPHASHSFTHYHVFIWVMNSSCRTLLYFFLNVGLLVRNSQFYSEYLYPWRLYLLGTEF